MRPALLLVAVLVAGTVVFTQGPAVDRGIRVATSVSALSTSTTDAAALSALRSWDQRISDMARSGDMRRTAAIDDAIVPGRVQERYEQRYQGVRVFGGGLTRQMNGFGQAESVFGTVYPDIAIDATPTISEDDAYARIGAAVGSGAGTQRNFELVVLPTTDSGYHLAWMARTFNTSDAHFYRVFVDARTGATLLKYNDTWTQSAAVGSGTGVLGDAKKVMSGLQSGKYLLVDLLRPADPLSPYGTLPKGSMLTFDLKNNITRAVQVLNTGSAVLSELGTDDDNTWTDSSLVDAHTYAGYTYDYYFKRFGRRGLDNKNIQVWSFVNPVRPQDYTIYYAQYDSLFTNAAYLGNGDIYYGAGLPSTITLGGQRWYPLAGALDVVAHELTHGVTDYTSQLIYAGESGALNESFSDMMGTAAEFYFQPVGNGLGQGDWLIGEDVVRSSSGAPAGLRSLSAPNSVGDPDHYSIRYTGSSDGGGVHTNSSIVNHMYYLAIMGGTNRVSKLTVTGVGFDNRALIESTIYRAFTALMPANATFSVARAATIQAARDLYGSNSAAERALTAAWAAVGVS